jgi:hypothetical protein
MNLSNFEMIEKADNPGGYQCVLEFDEKTQLSIITGRGAYGNDDAPYEIAVIVNGHMTEMPGITGDELVRGYMTESEVDIVIKKLYTLTGNQPEQV